MNLITNAAEAVGDLAGGIMLRTGVTDCTDDDLARSRLSQKPPAGRYAFVEVNDTGSGMDESTLERLFDPFFTTKFTGRGLGMSAVLGIMRSHKGAIFVESAVARGTRIRVLFPALEGGQAAASEPWPETPRPLALERDRVILIVDDEDIVRAPCEIYLRRYGFDVLSARNGNEALRIYEQRHREIDCVLLDLTMPGMSGLVVMREMRRIRSDSAIILMSGFSEQAALEDLVSDAPQGFIQKPYRLEELLAVIRRALDENDPS
ncbi:MAG: response regulator [Vicinamibacteria bacterium]|nr:response regulator [Vicinamibacteria bacterium]